VNRVLVTGAAGFIGKEVLGALSKLSPGSEVEIHGLSRHTPTECRREVVWHSIDLLSTDPDKLLGTIGASHLLHLAWTTARGTYWTSEENLAWLDASVRLLRSFRAAGGRRFVGVGTCSEYAPSAGPYSEASTPLAPWSIYGACKAALGLISTAFPAPGMTTAWARLFFLYGQGEPADRLVPRLLSAARSRESIRVHTDHTRDYLHVSDVATGLIALLLSDMAGPVNVASGLGVTVGDLAHAAAEAVNGEITLLPPVQEGSRFSTAPVSVVADAARIRSLGWNPATRLTDGLRAMASTTE
jgi:nucleoside-diphosphate-sugar epimerase